jgi:hypothetical protein
MGAEEEVDSLREDVKQIRARVYNGLGNELRAEVAKEIGGIRNLLIGVLISLVLALTGIVIQGRSSTAQSTEENNRNYAAILQLDKKLELHLQEGRLTGVN